MKIFGPLYDRVIQWSKHKHAPRYLAALSFAESSFFPIPPDVMLAPMSISHPKKASVYATIATLFSTLGGLFGYLVGMLAFTAILPLLTAAGYSGQIETAHGWFAIWGVWVVFVAGFSPIPYKVFTIAAGALGMPILPFILASFVGRGARFYLEAMILAWLGPKIEPKLRPYMEAVGWGMVVLLIIAVIAWRLFLH